MSLEELTAENQMLRSNMGDMEMISGQVQRALEQPWDQPMRMLPLHAAKVMAELKVWRQGGKPTPPVPPPI